MHIAQSGITFIVVKQLRLYFAHFHSWQSVREEVGVTDEIPPDAFQKFVIKEMQKVYNFYGTRESGTVQSMFVIATTDTASIREAIEANFNVRIKPLAIKRYGGLTPDWFAVLGAAARGTVAPSRDTDINVSGDPVRVQYERTRVLTFIRYWRNVLATTALFIALVYAGVTLFLRQEEMRVARGVDELTAAEEVAAVEVLQEEVQCARQSRRSR
jgi:hypothetical protein